MAVSDAKRPLKKVPGLRLFGHKVPLSARIGLVIIFLNLFLMIVAPFLAPYPEGFIPEGVFESFAWPSAQHWLGTDKIGRDILSQILYGARLSIGLSLLTTILAFVIGIIAGFTAAIRGRWVDILLSRFADLILSMPTLVFCLVVITVVMVREQDFVVATGMSNAFFEGMVIVVVIGLLYAVPVFRLARAVAMNIVALEYVEAARLRGESTWWVIWREILPNAIPPLVAEFGLRFCFTFLLIAALSFLGLGIQPPYQDWGSMVNATAQVIFSGKPQPLFPAAAIAILTIGINLVVDWLLSIYSPAMMGVPEDNGVIRTTTASRSSGDHVLDVEDLRIEVRTDAGPGPVLVDNVSLKLKQGEVLGLIGESGAGKSTIGLATMGYSRSGCFITGGKIIFRGKDVRTMTREERQDLRGHGVAYIAQSAAASFNPALTLYEQICEIALRRGLMKEDEAKAEAVRLFKELELPNPETFGERYPHQVSGGQLQRAMAAMAMITKPSILIFDEPTTALDVTTQVEVLASFRKLIREHGTAALYITHDLAVVAQIADRIMVLRHGKMIEVGDATQILQAPREEYTRRLVAERTVANQNMREDKKQTATPLLEIKNVVASYRSLNKVINDVSIDIQRGDTVAVVGESGSGKSTLARVVVGLLPRSQGDVKFQGQSLPARLQDRTKDQLRRIQMIYQMPDVALNPRQTLLEIIGRPIEFYFGTPKSQIKDQVSEMLRHIDLPESFINRRPGELSGGQKQRVCIARALAAKPELIICDEVTSALDQLVGEEILRLLNRLQDELGIAYMFITHDLGTVRRIANKVAVMLKGQLVAQGETAKIFNPPYHPYTELLLSSVPEMRADWLDEVLSKRTRRS